jgi:hypothetical protein
MLRWSGSKGGDDRAWQAETNVLGRALLPIRHPLILGPFCQKSEFSLKEVAASLENDRFWGIS